MTQSLEQFREQVLQNPDLAEQLKAVSSPDEFADLAVQLGQQMGYNFTAEEVKAAVAQHSTSTELNDAQLESIAGGTYASCGENTCAGTCGATNCPDAGYGCG